MLPKCKRNCKQSRLWSHCSFRTQTCLTENLGSLWVYFRAYRDRMYQNIRRSWWPEVYRNRHQSKGWRKSLWLPRVKEGLANLLQLVGVSKWELIRLKTKCVFQGSAWKKLMIVGAVNNLFSSKICMWLSDILFFPHLPPPPHFSVCLSLFCCFHNEMFRVCA